MKFNPLINEIARGQWMMSIPSLEVWGLMAHKIITGEKIELNQPNAQPKSLINFVTSEGTKLKPNADGQIAIPKGSVAIVDMIGAMIKYGDYCTYGADEIVGALEAANNNPNIEAIILNVDGPGGSVSSIGPFQQFAAKKQKPIVGYYDQCCSAHLYAMLLVSDYVMAQNDVSAQIGSVGVVLSWADNQKYLEKLGYTFHEVYPKESEHKNEAFRLAMEGNYELIKEEMLSPIAIKFQEAVKQARGEKLNLKEKGVLTGKTFYTDKAIEIGLTDGVGTLKDAVNMALMLKEIKYKP